MSDVDPVAPPPQAPLRPEPTESQKWAEQVRSGSGWIFAIAVLSAVNSLISVFGGEFAFAFGLAITELVDAAGIVFAEEVPEMSLWIKTFAFIVSLAAAGILGLLGYFSRKGKTWAFAVTSIGYGLDMLLVLAFEDFLGGLFHLLGLFYIVRGALSARRLGRRMEAV